MFSRRKQFDVVTERLILRLPVASDFVPWASLRRESAGFLQKWEPVRSRDYPTKRSFQNRVYWAARSAKAGTSFPYLITLQGTVIGGITLDNIAHGPAKSATVGYWIGQDYARQGYMREALQGVVNFAFDRQDISRIQAACLPENDASRGLLEKSGFKYEGVAQSYLQIFGRWRNHVLYANLRGDRRGESDAI